MCASEAREPAEKIEGTIEGVDSDGALLLRENGTLEKILAGDVTVLESEE